MSRLVARRKFVKLGEGLTLLALCTCLVYFPAAPRADQTVNVNARTKRTNEFQECTCQHFLQSTAPDVAEKNNKCNPSHIRAAALSKISAVLVQTSDATCAECTGRERIEYR